METLSNQSKGKIFMKNSNFPSPSPRMLRYNFGPINPAALEEMSFDSVDRRRRRRQTKSDRRPRRTIAYPISSARSLRVWWANEISHKQQDSIIGYLKCNFNTKLKHKCLKWKWATIRNLYNQIPHPDFKIERVRSAHTLADKHSRITRTLMKWTALSQTGPLPLLKTAEASSLPISYCKTEYNKTGEQTWQLIFTSVYEES